VVWVAWVHLVIVADLNTNLSVFDETVVTREESVLLEAIQPWSISGSNESNGFSILKIVSAI
jgi:hypothetical protein